MDRVLVVDDEAAARKLMRRMLEAEGYEVATAVDGEDALVQILSAPEGEHFDLVLLDLHMEGLTGWDFLRLKRQSRGRLAQLGIIIVSGALSQGEPQDLAGVAVMFPKPIDFKKLLQAMKHHLRDTVPPPHAA